MKIVIPDLPEATPHIVTRIGDEFTVSTVTPIVEFLKEAAQLGAWEEYTDVDAGFRRRAAALLKGLGQ